MKKVIRTLQTNFPMLLETKFAAARCLRNVMGIPFEADFRAIQYFPESDHSLFLDVGGNRGQSTEAILLYAKNSTIQIFEPNPTLCKRLENQYKHSQNVQVNQLALGDKPSEQRIYIPYYKNWMFDGLASLDRENPKLWLKENLHNHKESHVTLEEVKCEVKTLDELNLVPFFIKLDIQGYEYQALKGGENTIRANEPVLLIEAPDQQIIDYLDALGYRYFAFDRGKFRAQTKGKLNTFFMTKKRASGVEKLIV